MNDNTEGIDNCVDLSYLHAIVYLLNCGYLFQLITTIYDNMDIVYLVTLPINIISAMNLIMNTANQLLINLLQVYGH